MSRQRRLCSTAPSLPWVAWASLPHLHRDSAPLRLPSVPFGGFACRSPSRYLACFRMFVVSQKGSWSSGSPRPRQGLWSPGPPLRACDQGDRRLSHVPELPLGLHAPLSDPGGVLDTRPIASRTAAFRRLQTVGFPFATTEGYPLVHDSTHCGAQSRGLRPRYTRLRTAPYGEARGFAPDRLARLSSGRM